MVFLDWLGWLSPKNWWAWLPAGRIPLLLVVVLAFFLARQGALAQEAAGVAVSLPVASSVADGSVICSGVEGFFACDQEYDPSMVGVVADTSAVSLEPATGDEDGRLVVSSGKVRVRVLGEVGLGDFVTSSTSPGVAQKAIKNGYVLGVALEAFQPTGGGETEGSVVVAVNIHPEAGLSGPRSDLMEALRSGVSAPIFEPLDSLRYFLAAAMIVVSFTLGLIYFGRVTRAGVEAIGRNPLARRSIQFSIFASILLTIVIVFVGFGISYLILVL